MIKWYKYDQEQQLCLPHISGYVKGSNPNFASDWGMSELSGHCGGRKYGALMYNHRNFVLNLIIRMNPAYSHVTVEIFIKKY